MKKLFFSLLAMAALVSCETTEKTDLPEPTPDNNLVPIELRASVLGMEATTKAVIKDFNNTEIGVYGLKEGATNDSYVWSKTPYYYSGTNKVTISSDKAITFTQPVYYPIDDKKVKFYAYTTEGFTEKVDPTDTPAPAKIKYTLTDGKTDILFGKGVSGKISDSPRTAPTINFSHMLAKINFKVIAGKDFPETDYKVTKIAVTEVNSVITMSLEDNPTLTFETPTSLDAYADPSGTVIAAQGGAATEVTDSDFMLEPESNYKVEVTVCETANTANTTTFKVKSVLKAPAKGKMQTVTLTFNKTAIGGNASLDGWTEVDADASSTGNLEQ